MAVAPKTHDNSSCQLVDGGEDVGQVVQADRRRGFYDMGRNRSSHISPETPREATAHFDTVRAAA
jgi:hypothetical protein